MMNDIPDATTVAFFRQRLRKAGVIVELFERFEAYLRSQGLQARGGQIIDATLIPVPKQRNTREENADIKAGRLSEGWDENSDHLLQKDLDALGKKERHQSLRLQEQHLCRCRPRLHSPIRSHFRQHSRQSDDCTPALSRE
jgi:IS5 family transposase